MRERCLGPAVPRRGWWSGPARTAPPAVVSTRRREDNFGGGWAPPVEWARLCERGLPGLKLLVGLGRCGIPVLREGHPASNGPQLSLTPAPRAGVRACGERTTSVEVGPCRLVSARPGNDNRFSVPACGGGSTSVVIGLRRFIRAHLDCSGMGIPSQRREDNFGGGWAPLAVCGSGHDRYAEVRMGALLGGTTEVR